MPVFRKGTTRGVLVCGEIALKFGLGERGARCNLFEADLFVRTTPARRDMLCPVICCSENGAVLVVRAATPLTVAERDHLIDTDGFPDWDYLPWEGEAEPFEYKASDWGWLDGHLLSLDYSAPALTTAEEMAQIIANRQS